MILSYPPPCSILICVPTHVVTCHHVFLHTSSILVCVPTHIITCIPAHIITRVPAHILNIPIPLCFYVSKHLIPPIRLIQVLDNSLVDFPMQDVLLDIYHSVICPSPVH